MINFIKATKYKGVKLEISCSTLILPPVVSVLCKKHNFFKICIAGSPKDILGDHQYPVWPDWAIYWTLGNFLYPLAAIDSPKSSTFLGNFCKDVKIYHFSSEIILGNFYCHLATFCWVQCSPHKVSLAEYWSRLYELYHHNCKRI